MPNDNEKPWYYSKMLWFNIIAFIALMWQSYNGFVISPEEQGAVIILINLILRVFTGKELTK